MHLYGKNWDNGRRQQVITIAIAAATVVSVATIGQPVHQRPPSGRLESSIIVRTIHRYQVPYVGDTL
jgi:hypothetical protein